MKLNLASLIEDDIQKVSRLMIECGCADHMCENHVDLTYENKTYSIFFHERFLYYSKYEKDTFIEQTDDCDVVTGWVKCSILLKPEDVYETARTIESWIQNVFSMKIKTFFDEDSFQMRFTKETDKHNWPTLSFYVNPDYPNGWWENHTL